MKPIALNDNQLDLLLGKLKEDLEAFPEGLDNLSSQLESAARHLPAYIKIVKTHIEQLKAVLASNNHRNKTLETAGLSDCIFQLMKLFELLKEEDSRFIEELAIAARSWSPQSSESEAEEQFTASAATEHTIT